jgi:hypothetical protein
MYGEETNFLHKDITSDFLEHFAYEAVRVRFDLGR